MRKLFVVLLFVIATTVFSQEKTVVIGLNSFLVKASSTGAVSIQIDKILFSFRENKTNEFIKFLEAHISLFESISLLKMNEVVSEEVLHFNIDNINYIRTSIVVGDGEPRLRMFMKSSGSYGSYNISFQEMKSLLQTFKDMHQINNTNKSNRTELKRLIFEAQIKFRN